MREQMGSSGICPPCPREETGWRTRGRESLGEAEAPLPWWGVRTTGQTPGSLHPHRAQVVGAEGALTEPAQPAKPTPGAAARRQTAVVPSLWLRPWLPLGSAWGMRPGKQVTQSHRGQLGVHRRAATRTEAVSGLLRTLCAAPLPRCPQPPWPPPPPQAGRGPDAQRRAKGAQQAWPTPL